MTEKRVIRIAFCDFWEGFDFENNHFINILKSGYNPIIDTESPEFLFVGTFGSSHLRYNCPKILFTGENIVPDFNLFDYAIGFDHLSFADRYLRLPLYCLRPNFSNLFSLSPIDYKTATEREFCSIVVSNMKVSSPMRKKFFDLLSNYKQVSSGGRMWNNIGGPVSNKLDFLKKYKFNIAFENSSSHGYTTEKILDAYTAHTIPIYWGNPDLPEDFNPDSCIWVRDTKDIDRAIEEIIYLDNNDIAYYEKLNKDKLVNSKLMDWKPILFDFLNNIISKPSDTVKYTSQYGMQMIHRRHVWVADRICRNYKFDKLISLHNQLKLKFGNEI